MGYRSDGVWIIKGKPEVVTAAIVEARLTCPPPEDEGIDGFDLFEFYKRDDYGYGYIKLEYQGWKWYDSFPEIQWLESLWTLWSKNPDLSGERIRLGEDRDDVETDCFGKETVEVYVNHNYGIDEPEHGDPLINREEHLSCT